jgi:hypothetical protein
MLPMEQPHYRSGFLRLLELYSLATPPGTPLPSSEYVAGLAGLDPQPFDDLRDVAWVSLQMDQWTSCRAQVGRSLAYDSAFYIEPWRRNESVEESVNFLERHRFAAIAYWLRVVPPLCKPPRGRRQRRIVEQDQQLMWQYRSIAFLKAIADWPIYLQLYGGPEFKRLLKVDANSLTMYLIKCDEQLADLQRNAAKEFPEYAEERSRRAATVDEIRKVLGIG